MVKTDRTVNLGWYRAVPFARLGDIEREQFASAYPTLVITLKFSRFVVQSDSSKVWGHICNSTTKRRRSCVPRLFMIELSYLYNIKPRQRLLEKFE